MHAPRHGGPGRTELRRGEPVADLRNAIGINDGYLIIVPGKGSFAAEARPLQEQKKQELFSKIRSLSQQAMALGATREELLAQIPTKEEEA